MKFAYLFLLISIFLLGTYCSKEDPDPLIGTWIEKYPEKWDGISDTIVFTKDFLIEKHFIYKGFNYEYKNDSITFFNSYKRRSYLINFLNSNEIVIYNFLDRLATSVEKDIHFLKEN